MISNPYDGDEDGSVVINSMNGNGPDAPAMGPTPDRAWYDPWATNIPTLRCPSDPGQGLPSLGRTNYGVCLGDSYMEMVEGALCRANHSNGSLCDTSASGGLTRPDGKGTPQGQYERARAACRGAFVNHKSMQFRDILDGLANTIIMGEITTDLGDDDKRTLSLSPSAWGDGASIRDNVSYCRTRSPSWIDAERPQFWSDAALTGSVADGRGYRWAEFLPLHSGITTILPPNAEICTHGSANFNMIVPPSSRHQGGAHVLMGDGAVKFVTDSIEAGDSTAGVVWRWGAGDQRPGKKSPFGLWGALGTRAAKETIEEEI